MTESEGHLGIWTLTCASTTWRGLARVSRTLTYRPQGGRPPCASGTSREICTLTRAGGAASPVTKRARRVTSRAERGTLTRARQSGILRCALAMTQKKARQRVSLQQQPPVTQSSPSDGVGGAIQAELIARRVDQVLHQRQHGHGTGAARIERNPSRDFLHRFEIHVADE